MQGAVSDARATFLVVYLVKSQAAVEEGDVGWGVGPALGEVADPH